MNFVVLQYAEIWQSDSFRLAVPVVGPRIFLVPLPVGIFAGIHHNLFNHHNFLMISLFSVEKYRRLLIIAGTFLSNLLIYLKKDMKKLFVFLGSFLLLSGTKAQTTQAAKKETTRPATTKPGTPPPAKTRAADSFLQLGGLKGESSPNSKGPSQFKANNAKSVPLDRRSKK